jgi:hypothetical protein
MVLLVGMELRFTVMSISCGLRVEILYGARSGRD